MTDLTSLIERVEAATGCDGKLNAEIACAIFFPHLRPARPEDHKEFQKGFPPGDNAIWCPTGFLQAHNYTGSIDAALTLLPEGHSYAMGDCNEDNVPWASVTRCTGDWSDFAATGADVTLALLAAILRARQTEPHHDES